MNGKAKPHPPARTFPDTEGIMNFFSRARGFTMVELLVVMLLISLVTAFSIPRIRTGLFSDELKTASRKLVGFLTGVSQDAVRSHRAYELTFDLDKGLVTAMPVGSVVFADDKDQKDPRRKLSLPDGVRIVDVDTAHGGKDEEGGAALYFSDKGYVDKTAIHLRAEDGREMTLVLSPFMGVVRVLDSYVALEDDRARF
ncbi:MAG: hypothetical protein Kow0089_03580 [Desulfobulbaceae bacterium]